MFVFFKLLWWLLLYYLIQDQGYFVFPDYKVVCDEMLLNFHIWPDWQTELWGLMRQNPCGGLSGVSPPPGLPSHTKNTPRLLKNGFTPNFHSFLASLGGVSINPFDTPFQILQNYNKSYQTLILSTSLLRPSCAIVPVDRVLGSRVISFLNFHVLKLCCDELLTILHRMVRV